MTPRRVQLRHGFRAVVTRLAEEWRGIAEPMTRYRAGGETLRESGIPGELATREDEAPRG